MVTSLLDHIRGSWRILVKEVVAFGIVGFIALAIDLGIYNLMLHHNIGPLTAKLTAKPADSVGSSCRSTGTSLASSFSAPKA